MTGIGSVFVSYAGPDQKWADWITAQLTSSGYEVELATDDWINGSIIARNIERALRSNEYLLCLLSRAYFEEGRWSYDELASAINLQKKGGISPIFFLIEDIEPPPPFDSRLRHSLFGLSEGDARSLLLRELAKVVGLDTKRENLGARTRNNPIFPGFDKALWLPAVTAFRQLNDDDVVGECRTSINDLNQQLRKIPPEYQIELLESEIWDLARRHSYESSTIIVKVGTGLQSQLDQFRSEVWMPKLQSKLYEMQAALCGVMSYAMLDLGFAPQAFQYASAMNTIGAAIDRPAISAWALGTVSLIKRFEASNRDALDQATKALGLSVSERAAARIHGQIAISLANLGVANEIEDHLSKSAYGSVQEFSEEDLRLGIFNYGIAKHEYYAGIAYLKVGDFDRSAVHTKRAITLFEKGTVDDRSMTDWFLAHVHLASAHLGAGELDEISHDLGPLLSMPASLRTSWHVSKLSDFSDAIMSHADGSTLTQLSAQISSFFKA